MIGFDEAWAIVAGHAAGLEPEQVSLADAHGRTLAKPVFALVDWPPANVSAMDGYAVRDGDAGSLRLVGESWPGVGFTGGIGQGECVRIFTGAPVPAGADRVVMQENVARDGDRVTFTAPPSAGRHIRQQGSDFHAGEPLLRAGRRLDAQAMVAAAGADVAQVTVWRRPRATIIGTGDELVAPGTARGTSESIPESVSFGVAAIIAEWGGETISRRRVRDDPALIGEVAAEALEASDLVVVTGGASVGERDFSRSVLVSLGLDLLFEKVSIKPGKPVWFGRAGGTLVLGLPGNPTSAMVTARLLLAPLVAGLVGRDPRVAARWQSVRLAAPLGACGDRETFVRAVRDDDGVRPIGNQDSGAQKSLADANALIRQRAGTAALDIGALAEVIDF